MQKSVEAPACLRLKKGKERPLLQRHHWIFSGAVQSFSSKEPGGFAKVFTHENELLGTAMIGSGQSIVAHMISFGEEDPLFALRERIKNAFVLRKKIFDFSKTNAYRLINAEGDGIAGLIVDSYDGRLVLQISHPALERLKEEIVSILVQEIHPVSIFEKSTSFLRKKEGMGEVRAHLYGDENPQVVVLENGLFFAVHLLDGQKTGLFLDQREMRDLVCKNAYGKRVLNCFAYTGGFSVAALAGGASHVDSVEISAKCLPQVTRNLELNALDVKRHQFFSEDAISFVAKKELDYDFVILDPPAFVKKKQDIATAFRAYKDLNKTAIEKMPANSLLLTCSCSYHVGEALFQNILFRASLEAGRNVKILSSHRGAFDHPVSIFHPEGTYLKSLLLYIE